MEKVSLIKQFENKRDRELEEYFDLTDIDKYIEFSQKCFNTDKATAIKEYEKTISEKKMPDHFEEEINLYKNLTFDQWLNEIEVDYKLFLNAPDDLIMSSVLTSEEKEKLSILVFEKYGKVSSSSVKYFSKEYINKSDLMRKYIIEGKGISAINSLETLSYDEKIKALKNSTYQSINKVLETSTFLEHEYFLNLYFCLEGTFRYINNWKTLLTSELITLIIDTSTEKAEYNYGMLKDHTHYKPYHTFLLIKKDPSIIGLIEYVANEFGNIYIKTKDNKESELDLIMELSKSWHNLPVELHPLFMSFNNKPSIIKYDDFYKAYKELYS